MKIGDKEYRVTRPENLDEQLTTSTGLSADETAQRLAGSPIAGHVAAALRPFLPASAPSVPELAAEIDAAGLDDVRAQVVKLYGEKPAAGAAPKAGSNG